MHVGLVNVNKFEYECEWVSEDQFLIISEQLTFLRTSWRRRFWQRKVFTSSTATRTSSFGWNVFHFVFVLSFVIETFTSAFRMSSPVGPDCNAGFFSFAQFDQVFDWSLSVFYGYLVLYCKTYSSRLNIHNQMITMSLVGILQIC